MSQTKKILFTDLDGTLLDDSKNITPENTEAIRRALQEGHKIVVATGRPLAGALPVIRTLRLEQEGCYAITYNGGLIYDCYSKNIIFKKSLPLPHVYKIFSEAEKRGLHCQTYSADHVLAKALTPELDDYIKNTLVPPKISHDFLEHLTDEPVKILVIDLNHPEKLQKYREDMTEWAKGKVSLFFSNPYYLEHVAEGISKGSAIRILCDYLGIPLEHTIAAGDAENDIPMLTSAGLGVAMCNGSEEVKRTAGYVTKCDNNHSGIAEIITKFMVSPFPF